MSHPKSYQIDSEPTGAVGMACQKAQTYADAARAPGTRDVYARSWALWAAWCESMHVEALPAAPAAVAAYLAERARAGKSVAGIKVTLAAILYVHRQEGQPLESCANAIEAVMAGIARRSARPIRRARPLELDDLRSLIADIAGDNVRALRDRALLLVGFFAALRRSEIVALDVKGRSFVETRPEGLLIHLTATKASAKTETIAIPRRDDDLCPVAALASYLAITGIKSGPLFRPVTKGGQLVNRRLDVTGVRYIVKVRTDGVGKRFTPHSLRAGFITSAAKAGAPEHSIQRVSRHKSVEMLRSYIRVGDAFEGCAAHYL